MSRNSEISVSESEVAPVQQSSAPSLAQVQSQIMSDIAEVYPAGSISKWFAERRAVHDLRKLPHVKRQIDIDAAIASYEYHANRPLMIQQTQDREVVRRGMARFDMELANEAIELQADANQARSIESMREAHVLSEAANNNAWARQKEGFEIAEAGQKAALGRDLVRMREEHRLNEDAKASDWTHRKEEHVVVGYLGMYRLLVEAASNATRQSSTEERIEALRLVHAEYSRVINDPDLSDQEKHLYLSSLIDMMPTFVKAARATDV